MIKIARLSRERSSKQSPMILIRRIRRIGISLCAISAAGIASINAVYLILRNALCGGLRVQTERNVVVWILDVDAHGDVLLYFLLVAVSEMILVVLLVSEQRNLLVYQVVLFEDFFLQFCLVWVRVFWGFGTKFCFCWW